MTKTQQLLALCEAATPGPWEWINPEDDSPWSGSGYASLRTVKRYGEDKTEVRNGLHYTSFSLPKFLIEAEDISSTYDAAFITACNPAEIKRMVEVMLMMREALSFYMTPPIGQLNDHHIEAAKRGVAAIAAFDEFNNAKSEPTAPLLAQVSSTDGLGVARIAELEAELEKALWLATDKQIALAALRKRIADAPVVADVSSWWNGGTGFDLCNFKGKRPEPGAKLIIKEDLL